MNIDEIIEQLAHKKDLSNDQAQFAMEEILKGEMNDQQLGLFITLLHDKGETASELASLVRAMWANSPSVEGLENSGALDTCGTGGDSAGTFNISTAVSLVLSACSLPIAKHGNRAASSKCGAADVLEALGIPIELSVQDTLKLFNSTGFTFLFAQTFHPGMRHAAPVRKALGIPTTFNFLGPLANPYHAPYRMHGVSQQKILKTYIEALRELGVERAYVFHGHGGIDEIALSGTTQGYLLADNEIISKDLNPSEFGFEKSTTSDLQGGDAQTNASIINNIFAGEQGPKRDIVVLNSAVGLDLVKGMGLANAIEIVSGKIDSGEVSKKVHEISTMAKSLYS